ncbi:proSAP-interacting-like protein, putative, partial [Medicago truncatula]
FFQAIEQDASIIPEIKELLRKLNKPPFGSKFQEFSQILEPLMEDINLSFHQKKTDQSRLEDQTLLCNQLMAEITKFQEKFVTFRQETPDAKQKVEELKSVIAKHEEEIRLLKLQIANVLEKEDLVQKEASFVHQKIKESQTFQQEIATLVDNGKVLDEKLAEFKGKLNKLKSEFVI